MILIFLLWGMIAGYFAGFLGIGAGVLLMPFLALMGIPYQTAVDASLMAVFASSVTGTIQHSRVGELNWEPCIIIAIPGAIFALLGSIYLIHWFSPRLLQVVFAGIMFLNVDLLKISTNLAAMDLMPLLPSEDDNKRYFIHYILIGIVSGLMASLLGIGGGILIVTMLTVMAKFTIKNAVKTAVVVMVATTFFSLCADLVQNNLPYEIGIPAAIGAVIGSFFGTIALSYVENSVIRKINYVLSFDLGLLMMVQVLFV